MRIFLQFSLLLYGERPNSCQLIKNRIFLPDLVGSSWNATSISVYKKQQIRSSIIIISINSCQKNYRISGSSSPTLIYLSFILKKRKKRAIQRFSAMPYLRWHVFWQILDRVQSLCLEGWLQPKPHRARVDPVWKESRANQKSHVSKEIKISKGYPTTKSNVKDFTYLVYSFVHITIAELLTPEKIYDFIIVSCRF